MCSCVQIRQNHEFKRLIDIQKLFQIGKYLLKNVFKIELNLFGLNSDPASFTREKQISKQT